MLERCAGIVVGVLGIRLGFMISWMVLRAFGSGR